MVVVKKMLYNVNKFFEIHIGWFFINGHKQEAYYEYLRKKYDK